ncbi:MAG: tetratricopeptide repeat protein [Candidatus Obscuribacterales bacterium]|nr:tetratricopeptide repeat protein [Candidatus Obscuribacterales bacterium]
MPGYEKQYSSAAFKIMNIHYERATNLYDNRRFEMAEKELYQALAEDPEDHLAYRMLALTLFALTKYEAALMNAEKAISLDPEDAHSHYVLSLVLAKQKKYRDAERAIDEAKELSPQEALYHVEDAYLALCQGLSFEAQSKIRHALSLDPNDERALRILALATEQSGDTKSAISYTEEALKLAPESEHSQALMGRLLLNEKKTAAALIHYREALRINPTLDWAREGYMKALNSRNPLYGFILGVCWFADQPPRLVFGHPFVIAAMLCFWLIMMLSANILNQISKHLLTMFMRFDPVAVEALDPQEIKQSNFLAGWLAAAFFFSSILIFNPLHPFFLPAVAILYGSPLLFTRLFELKSDPPEYEKCKHYLILAGITAALAVIASLLGPDTLSKEKLPPNLQDLSAVLISIFIFMCLFSRRFCAGSKGPSRA